MTIIIRVRILSEVCVTCGARSGQRCTTRAKSGKTIAVDWTHAR